jgi:hypothetical protein
MVLRWQTRFAAAGFFSHVFGGQALLKLKLGPSLPVGYNPPRIIPFQA